MARRPLDPEKLARLRAEAEMSSFLGPAKPKKAAKKRANWDRGVASEEVQAMVRSQDWATAKPKHFVELYALLHRQVYGVEPLELRRSGQRLSAAGLAARALKEHFAGDPDAMADFMRWSWVRLAREEKERRAGTRQGSYRMGWQAQWAPRLVTDYRRHVVAKGGG